MDMHTIMASTVHDVKNSLGLIDNQLNEIVGRLDGIDATSAQELRRIQLECSRINNGMIHMLGLYRLEMGSFRSRIEEVMVIDVIQDTTVRYTELLTSLGVTLKVDYEDEGFLWYMDANLIEGLLGNVVTNAIRYTNKELVFNISVIDNWLRIRISDDGLGYPESLLTILDQPEEISFSTGGTGLGLFFCQKIAQMHVNDDKKGYIELTNDSETGGAVFDLWLP